MNDNRPMKQVKDVDIDGTSYDIAIRLNDVKKNKTYFDVTVCQGVKVCVQVFFFSNRALKKDEDLDTVIEKIYIFVEEYLRNNGFSALKELKNMEMDDKKTEVITIQLEDITTY